MGKDQSNSQDFYQPQPTPTPTPQPEPKLPDPVQPPLPDISWYNWALSKVGTVEWSNPGLENPEIVDCFRYTSYHATSDEVPWCAAFICKALEVNGYKSTHNAGAQSYDNFGVRSEIKKGAIVTFRWPNGGRNVALATGLATDTTIQCLGGNQSNSVRI